MNPRCAQKRILIGITYVCIVQSHDKNEEMIAVELEGSNCRIYGLKEKKKGNNL